MNEIHASRHVTKTGAIRVGPENLWECVCGKRYKSRQGFRTHLKGHAHRWRVTRYVPRTQVPFVRECDGCGEIRRYHRGRWIVTRPGK